MGDDVSLGIPFVSEAYDRLVAAQQARRRESTVEAINTGAKLRAARAEMGLTQAALGELLGIAAPQVSLMEGGGDRIKPQTDLSVRYLLLEHRK